MNTQQIETGGVWALNFRQIAATEKDGDTKVNDEGRKWRHSLQFLTASELMWGTGAVSE